MQGQTRTVEAQGTEDVKSVTSGIKAGLTVGIGVAGTGFMLPLQVIAKGASVATKWRELAADPMVKKHLHLATSRAKSCRLIPVIGPVEPNTPRGCGRSTR